MDIFQISLLPEYRSLDNIFAYEYRILFLVINDCKSEVLGSGLHKSRVGCHDITHSMYQTM